MTELAVCICCCKRQVRRIRVERFLSITVAKGRWAETHTCEWSPAECGSQPNFSHRRVSVVELSKHFHELATIVQVAPMIVSRTPVPPEGEGTTCGPEKKHFFVFRTAYAAWKFA